MTAVNILDRPLNKNKGLEVNFSSLAQLFAEYINLNKEIAADITELELRYPFFQLNYLFNSQNIRPW